MATALQATTGDSARKRLGPATGKSCRHGYMFQSYKLDPEADIGKQRPPTAAGSSFRSDDTLAN